VAPATNLIQPFQNEMTGSRPINGNQVIMVAPGTLQNNMAHPRKKPFQPSRGLYCLKDVEGVVFFLCHMSCSYIEVSKNDIMPGALGKAAIWLWVPHK